MPDEEESPVPLRKREKKLAEKNEKNLIKMSKSSED